MKNILAAFVLATLTACANPINEYTAHNYYQIGESALSRGDLTVAKEAFRRALINAQLGHMGPQAEGQLLMKLGRVLGNLCEYNEANQAFSDAIRAYDSAYGDHSPRTFPARAELAQFSYDVMHYADAVRYFEDALPLGEKIMESSDPQGYSFMLDDYADALAQVGRTTDSERIKSQANILRNKPSSARIAKGRNYVPYPKECGKVQK